MAYLYRTILHKDLQNVFSPPPTNNADKTDFETNYKSQATMVGDIVIAQTTFMSELSYASFKAKVVSPLGWVDVKYLDGIQRYVLNLLTENPL